MDFQNGCMDVCCRIPSTWYCVLLVKICSISFLVYMKTERTYGHGLGLRKEDKTRCVKAVWSGFTSSQCSKKRGFGENGEYCKVHDPEYIKKKDLEKTIEYDKTKCTNIECNFHFDGNFSYYKFCPYCGLKK